MKHNESKNIYLFENESFTIFAKPKSIYTNNKL